MKKNTPLPFWVVLLTVSMLLAVAVTIVLLESEITQLNRDVSRLTSALNDTEIELAEVKDAAQRYKDAQSVTTRTLLEKGNADLLELTHLRSEIDVMWRITEQFAPLIDPRIEQELVDTVQRYIGALNAEDFDAYTNLMAYTDEAESHREHYFDRWVGKNIGLYAIFGDTDESGNYGDFSLYWPQIWIFADGRIQNFHHTFSKWNGEWYIYTRY